MSGAISVKKQDGNDQMIEFLDLTQRVERLQGPATSINCVIGTAHTCGGVQGEYNDGKCASDAVCGKRTSRDGREE